MNKHKFNQLFSGFSMIFAVLLFVGTASAATLTVTKTTDTSDGTCDADCSLREAITAAAANDEIVFAAPLFLTSQIININGQLSINKNLTVTGRGANLLTVRNTAAASRVFNITGGTVKLFAMTVTGGNLSAGDGGGIRNSGGTLTLTEMHITDNRTLGIGGGIRNDPRSTLNINRCTISGNTGTIGGGIDNSGGMLIETSTISGNAVTSTGNSGGGIGTGGEGTGAGGVQTGATIRYSTITNNSAPSQGNNAGGIKHSARALSLSDNIIAGNTSATNPDIISGSDGTLTSGGYNLVGNLGLTPRTINFSSFDLLGTNNNSIDPLLLPLANNGGSTPTHALMPSSPAIDRGKCQNCYSDQRREPRPIDIISIANVQGGDGSDVGAFEMQNPTAASVSVCGRVVTTDGRGLRNAQVILTDQSGTRRTVLTGAFGYYRFAEVSVGQTVIIEVYSKRYNFAAQIVSVMEEIENLDFTAQQNKNLDFTAQ